MKKNKKKFKKVLLKQKEVEDDVKDYKDHVGIGAHVKHVDKKEE